jgi:hypothetical protein
VVAVSKGVHFVWVDVELILCCKCEDVPAVSIKPTTAQLHLYNLLHFSAVTIRPSSGRTYFLNKSA